MTAPELDLLAAFDHVFGPQDRSRPRPVDPATLEDEDTLRRSFGGLSRRAKRTQRRGRYFPAQDADGIDRDGWAHGAEYPRSAS